MTIIGWDSAVDKKNNGLVLSTFSKDHLTILETGDQTVEPQITLAGWLSREENILIAIDSPLGWPVDFCINLTEHTAGGGISAPPDAFFKRKTDLFIHEKTGKIPMEVTANLIARSTFYTLNRLAEVRKLSGKALPLLWDYAAGMENGVIEVYPAAVLHTTVQQYSSYKKDKGIRKNLLKKLQTYFNFTAEESVCENDHIFDAFLCCLAAVDFIKGNALKPPPEIPETVLEKEGWAWVRRI